MLHGSIVVVLIEFIFLVRVLHMDTPKGYELCFRRRVRPSRSHSLCPYRSLCFNLSIPPQHGLFVLELDDEVFYSRIALPKDLNGVVSCSNLSTDTTQFFLS